MVYALARTVSAIQDTPDMHARSSKPVPRDPLRMRNLTVSENTFVVLIPRVLFVVATVRVLTDVVFVWVNTTEKLAREVSLRMSSFVVRTSRVRSVRFRKCARDTVLVWILSVRVRRSSSVVIVLKTLPRESVRMSVRAKECVPRRRASARVCQVGRV